MIESAPRFIVGQSYLNCQDYPHLTVGKGGIEFTTTFINFTGKTIYVIDRSGIRFGVPASAKVRTDQFIIRKKYFIPRDSVLDIQRTLTYTDLCHDDYPELAAFSQGFKNYSDNHPTNHSIVIDTPIDVSEIRKGSSYVTNHDIVLTFETIDKKVPHPFAKPHLAEARYESFSAEYKGLGTFVEIVDNENEIGDRFMLIAKAMRRIAPRRDLTRESGIYLVTIDEDSTTSVHHAFSDAESVGLYRTKEEAISAGDTAALLEADVARLSHEVKTQTLEHQRETNRLNREHEQIVTQVKQRNLEIEGENKTKEAELQRIQRERDNDRAQFELKQATMKAEFERERLREQQTAEQRNNSAKFKTEVFKLTAAAISGGLVIFAAIKKNSK